MKLFLSIALSLFLFIGGGFALQAHAQVAGCATTGGYNTSNGTACNGATVIPLGCTSTAGFSGATGMPCNGNTAAANGYNGVTIGGNGFINGCTSNTGYSATTGQACNMAVNGIIYTGNGTTVNTGITTTPPITTVSPALPTTGAGNQAIPTMLVLIASGALAFLGVRYSVRQLARQ
ncbi:MAG TPA: hypothetical protein VL576_02555 [Candidatus Paceibacterota bacterium]|jgi:hypothetical protein|nr:hypothetical protein [Candidatus Paceibacterota bacterium]